MLKNQELYYYRIMNDKEFIATLDNIDKKLEKDQASMIADDIGTLMTGFESMQKELKDRNDRIKQLESDKEKLISSNSNLLKRIAVTPDDGEEQQEKATPSLANFNFKDAFDEKGNFKK